MKQRMPIADQFMLFVLLSCCCCVFLGPVALIASLLSVFGVGEGVVINGMQASSLAEKAFTVFL